MIKRLLIATMASASLVGAAEAKGSTGPERHVQASYHGPQIYWPHVSEGYPDPFRRNEFRRCLASGLGGCISLDTGATESSLTARVRDALGKPVSVWVVAAPTSSTQLNSRKIYGTFCGQTTQPISFDPGTKVEFWIGSEWWPTWWVYPDLRCNPGPATTGIIDITLSGVS